MKTARLHPRRNTNLLRVPLAFWAIWLTGCGAPAENRPEVQPVQGSMTINGQPPVGAMLVFHPAEEFDARGTRPRATIEEDGQFSVTTYQAGDGIPAGEYDVAVLWFDNPDASAPHDKLGGRYAQPDKAGIHVTIEEGQTELAPITLDGARIVPRRPRASTPDFDGVD